MPRFAPFLMLVLALLAGCATSGARPSLYEQFGGRPGIEALVEELLVRILDDLPEIAGMDRPYRLAKNDVVNLPAPIGCALIKRGKAQEIVPFWRKAE